jgi:hypothetical protein
MTPKNRVLIYIVGILVIMISSSFIFPRYGNKNVVQNKQPVIENNIVEEKQTSEVIGKPFEGNQTQYAISIEVPTISGMLDTVKQEKTNIFMQEAINKLIADFETKAPIKLIDDTQSSLEIGYETVYLSDSLASIKLNISEYITGDSNPTVSTKMLNFDVDNSKEIVLEDIFNKDSQYLFFLSTLTAQQLLNSYNGVGDEAINFIKNITSSKKENFQTFGFDKEGLIIYFQTDQIGSLAIGAEEIKIKADQNMLGYVIDGPIKTLWSSI